jgi:peptide chain release factor 3
VQLFRDPHAASATLILGAMGPLQFEVMRHRLDQEYGVLPDLTPLPFKLARWPQGEFDPEIFKFSERIKVVRDREGRHALLAQSEWDLSRALERHEDLVLADTADPALFDTQS